MLTQKCMQKFKMRTKDLVKYFSKEENNCLTKTWKILIITYYYGNEKIAVVSLHSCGMAYKKKIFEISESVKKS